MKTLLPVRIIMCAATLLLGALCVRSRAAAGDVDLSFDAGSSVSNPVSFVVVQPDGKVLIGGPLTFINGANRYASARLNADGSLDSTFIPDSFHPDWSHLFQNGFFNHAEVAAVAVQSDGKVLVGGVVAHLCFVGEPECQNTFASFVTRLNANGSHDTNFTPFIGDFGLAVEQIPQLRTLAVQPDGKVVAGYVGFGLVRGIVRLNANGIRDANFNTSIGSGLGVDSIVPQADGKLLIGGPFNTVNGANRNALARLNSDGSLDNSFTPASGVGGSPLALQPDGKVLVRGYARLNADGSLDGSFNPAVVAPGAVRALALQADGNVLIGGDFLTVNGVLRPYVARMFGNSLPPVTFASWAAGFGLTGAAAPADADPDRDGLPNGLEFILGGNPVVSAGPASSNPAVGISGSNMLFTFIRNDESETPGVTLSVQSGTNLLNWPTVFSIGATTASSSPGVAIAENGSAPDTIIVAIPMGTERARFARLRVSIAP